MATVQAQPEQVKASTVAQPVQAQPVQMQGQPVQMQGQPQYVQQPGMQPQYVQAQPQYAQQMQGQPVQMQGQPQYVQQPGMQPQYVQAQPQYMQQPNTNMNQQNIVINANGGGGYAQQINPACPIVIFIVGWFVGPVWWAACCMLCEPRYGKTGKIFNIISTVLGIIGPICYGIAVMYATVWSYCAYYSYYC
jgi:hypothetical protein